MSLPEDVNSEHDDVERFDEDGREFAICKACGASWSVFVAQDARGVEFDEFESIDHGDDSCAQKRYAP